MAGGGFGGATARSFPKYNRLDSLRPSSTALENSSAISDDQGLDQRGSVMEGESFAYIQTAQREKESFAFDRWD